MHISLAVIMSGFSNSPDLISMGEKLLFSFAKKVQMFVLDVDGAFLRCL